MSAKTADSDDRELRQDPGAGACPWAAAHEPLLSGFADGELGWLSRRRVSRHLGRCAACAEVVKSQERVRSLLQAAERPVLPDARREAYVGGVLARVKAEGSRHAPLARWSSTARAAWVLGSACALACIVMVGVRSAGPAGLGPLSRIDSIEMGDYPIISYESPETGVTVLWALGFEESSGANGASKGAG